MYGSQPKLSCVVESSLTWDLFLGFYSQDFDLRQQSQWSLEKAAKIWGRHHWFLRKMTFGNDCRNFILATSCVPTQIWVVLLIAIFPRQTTNQKHYPDLGIGTSSVWNFCSHFSDVNSQGHQWWCWKISAVFSRYLTVVQFSWCKVAMQLGVAMWVVTGLDVDPSSCSCPKAPFIYGEKFSWVEGTLPYQMWWAVYVRNKKLASLEEWPAQPGGRETALFHHNDFVHS